MKADRVRFGRARQKTEIAVNPPPTTFPDPQHGNPVSGDGAHMNHTEGWGGGETTTCDTGGGRSPTRQWGVEFRIRKGDKRGSILLRFFFHPCPELSRGFVLRMGHHSNQTLFCSGCGEEKSDHRCRCPRQRHRPLVNRVPPPYSDRIPAEHTLPICPGRQRQSSSASHCPLPNKKTTLQITTRALRR